ncbi:uncharacterized protein TRAVEDRAFT_22871 [Trametes versicolor FP-101664 SS1]|uniref:uncharacterized protein n=1 Tax=Trametes versicolor (strain FP-101664) TaxID=717944 RepID=UPI0004622D6A|nr:uncharacterized protein TRAVEDRAFT_22871 [Trametes versicolor FP-101664 SS1]EIW55090.1 hypothetical protein TRAVEDRAFT_22871 [Trametes versicolor FP-101664 SS1]
MAPKPAEVEETEKPDPRAPRIILRTLPSLSFSTPTHTVRIQLSIRPQAREKDPRSRAWLGAPRPESHAVDAGIREALVKQRAAISDRIKERSNRVQTLMPKLSKDIELLPDALESLFAEIDPTLCRAALSIPFPQDSTLVLAAQVSSPAVIAKAVQLEELVNGIRASMAEIETALKEIQADVGGIKLDHIDIEMASVVVSWAARVQVMNDRLDGVARTLQLYAALRVAAARIQPMGGSR